MDDRVYLVAFDTDRVKDYIFATTDLKKIRGASTLLEHLNRDETPDLIAKTLAGTAMASDEAIKGGGMAIAVAPTREVAEGIIHSVERCYREATVDGTITGVAVEVPRADLETKRFARWYALVGSRLRAAKDQKGVEPAVPLAPYMQPCAGCGRHPARHMDPDEEGVALCTACYAKHRYNHQGRNVFRSESRDYVRPDGDTIWTTFPEDLGDLGEMSHPAGYVGFVLADGNHIGRYLKQVAGMGMTRFRTFSNRLDRIIREVTYGALLANLPHTAMAHFEVLLMGGDDLMLVTRADKALQVAMQIADTFGERATALAEDVGLSGSNAMPAPSLSAGVVLAHDHFPIKMMHDLASDLLRNAKRASAERDHQATVDFMVVTEAATAGLKTVREDVLTEQSFLTAPSPGESYALTERPYTLDRLSKLTGHASDLKKAVPRSGLQAIYEALFQSSTHAQAVTRATVARAKKDARAHMWQFIHDMEIDPERAPWREREPLHYSTPLGDLVEITPFVD